MIGARHVRVVAYVFDDIVVLSTMMLAIDSYLVVLCHHLSTTLVILFVVISH